jgi:putative N6-adenine-specific DNA methylase
VKPVCVRIPYEFCHDSAISTTPSQIARPPEGGIARESQLYVPARRGSADRTAGTELHRWRGHDTFPDVMHGLDSSALGLAATCTRGLEGVVAGELRDLGATAVTTGRGVVRFRGDPLAAMRANLWLRAAMRVLVELTEGAAGRREELYDLAGSVAWEQLMARGQTLAVEVAGRSESFPSSAFAALTVKDAVVDRLRSCWGSRPDVDRTDPDIRIHVHLNGAHAALSLDASGEPLSHRGWRPRGGPAPLAESLAAGILLLAGFDGCAPLVDPMCGTGTFAIEGALIATRRAPGLHRPFACERWMFADGRELEREREAARTAIRRAPAGIHAADEDARAVRATLRNARAAEVSDEIRVVRRDVRALEVPTPGSVVVINPPYGHRLGDRPTLRMLYGEIGDALKRVGAGCTAWILSGSPELTACIGLRPSRRIVVFNGAIECRLLRFELYQGSRRSPRGA